MFKRLLTALTLIPVFIFTSFANENEQTIRVQEKYRAIDPTAPLVTEPMIDTALWDDLPQNPIMMWRIEKDGHSAHIVGSLHMGTRDLYPLPAVMTNALLESDTAVFEIDPKDIGQDFSERLAQIGQLPEEQNLRDLLDSETAAKLNTSLKHIYMPKSALDHDKPWMAALKLTFSYMMRSHGEVVINYGIDRYFIGLSKLNRKEIKGLETTDEQIDLFKTIPEDISVEFLKKTLDELDDLENIIKQMVRAWKQGSTDDLWKIVNESFSAYPDVYNKWVVERNRNWANAIDRLFKEKTRAFIVVGAAHVSGPDSLQEMLKARGYHVEQVTTTPLATAP